MSRSLGSMIPPRWKASLDSAIAKDPSANVFQLATTQKTQSRKVVPRVRSHIFRAFLSPPTHPSTHLIITTADRRTPKVDQILYNTAVELAWWIEGANEQYRISGIAAIIPELPRPGADTVFYDDCMSLLSEGPEGNKLGTVLQGFDWEAKRWEIFRSLSPYMRASWCRPVPGSPLKDDPNRWPVKVEEPTNGDSREERENKKNWEMAYSNFALLVINPIGVDHVDMASKPNRRYFFTKKGNAWDPVEVVP